jgi:hypothetical protein
VQIPGPQSRCESIPLTEETLTTLDESFSCDLQARKLQVVSEGQRIHHECSYGALG